MRKPLSIPPPADYLTFSPSELFRFFFQIGRWTEDSFSADFQNYTRGLAVFATAPIPKGSRITVFTGETYQSETALGVPEIMRNHVIQVGKTEFIFGHKGLAHCVCHSCDPNCGIRNLVEIYAVKNISEGEQITWDYRCSENSNWVLDNCLCGNERCTGFVGNYDSLPSHFKSEYKAKGMVSEWIVQSEPMTKHS